MMSFIKSKMSNHVFLGATAGIALGLGTYLPQVATISGYTYRIVNNVSAIYALAIAMIVFSVFRDQLSGAVAAKIDLIASILIGVALVCASAVYLDGLNWFQYQIAGDMASWDSINKDMYWTKLYQLAGLTAGTSVFNDLRLAYETYGSSVTINDQSVFWNTINGLTKDQASQLTSIAGGGYLSLPVGIVFIAGSLMLQIKIAITSAKQLPETSKTPTPLNQAN